MYWIPFLHSSRYARLTSLATLLVIATAEVLADDSRESCVGDHVSMLQAPHGDRTHHAQVTYFKLPTSWPMVSRGPANPILEADAEKQRWPFTSDEIIMPWWNENPHNTWRPNRKEQDEAGIRQFFSSAEIEEWVVFSGLLLLFVFLQWYLNDQPMSSTSPGGRMVFWLALGAICNVAIYFCLGAHDAQHFLSGYALEIVATIDNSFVFLLMLRSFKMPPSALPKCFSIIVIMQVLFQWLFFMGLATAIRSIGLVPYVLGAFLLYAAYSAFMEDPEAWKKEEQGNLEEGCTYCFAKKLLGTRVLPAFDASDKFIVERGGKYCFTLLSVALVCLIAADFALEIDVVLIKIEMLKNHYIAFISSAAASFVMPEMVFMAETLFERFSLLKYGICCVLFMQGSLFLIHRLFTITTFAQTLATVCIIAFFILLSELRNRLLGPPEAKAGKTALKDDALDDSDQVYEVTGGQAAKSSHEAY